MPVFNSRGDVLAGWGDSILSVNALPFALGGRGGWITDLDVIVRIGDDTVRWRHGEGQVGPPLLAGGANLMAGGGGAWAAWRDTGLYLSTGQHLPAASAAVVGQDGAIAYCPEYQRGTPWVVQEVTGETWQLTASAPDGGTHGANLHLLQLGRAVWTEGNVLRQCGDLPPCVTVGPVYGPRAAWHDGAWWVAYWTPALGTVAHPFDSTWGYVLTTGDAFALDLCSWASTLWATWSRGAGEFDTEVAIVPIDLTLPRVQLAAPDPPDPPQPPIVQPPTATITSYGPMEGTAPLSVAAQGVQTGGDPATRIEWLWRFYGTRDWASVADDWHHTYVLGEGEWEIALRVSNRAGSDQTSSLRLVYVAAAPEPPEPPEPTEPPPMGLPDYDTFVNVESPDVARAYKSVNPDPSVPTPQQMGHTAWRRLVEAWTHRDIVHDIKGEPLQDGGAGGANKPTTPPPTQPGPTPPGDVTALRKDGRVLRDGSGARFLWRGATSFRLLHMIANGEESQAIALMQTLRAMGYNLVRVLATAKHLFNLPMDTGRASLRRLFDLAWQHKLYVEIVPLADTDDWPKGQLEAQLQECYSKACEYPNVLVEGGNEIGPCHETQSDEAVDMCRLFSPHGPALYCPGSVHGGGFCQEQSALTPEQWETGNSTGQWPYWDEVYTYSRDFGTSHLKRDGSDAERGRRVRELEASSYNAKCLFVDDEPLGADEVLQPGKRSNEPGVFYLQGVLQRIFEVGSTFHSSDGLQSRPFQPAQQGCAEAFINGSRIVADDVQLAYKNAGWHDSPIKEFTGAVRIYSGVGADNIACVIGPEAHLNVTYQNGWRANGYRAEVTGCKVINLVQG